MRRTTAVVAGLMLVGSLAACGQDSPEETNAEFCSAISALQAEVATFNTQVQAGAEFDALQVQAQAVVAASKEVSAVTQRLDEGAKNEMNAASEQLDAAVGAIDDADMTAQESVAAAKSAVDAYAATASEVSAQVGCTSSGSPASG
jgi:hypothetical protein